MHSYWNSKDGQHAIYNGDCLETLRQMPDESVHCCVTSPPYWGLRDYGHDGQIGLEPTPDAYVANMVAVFREVRRVLRDDGTLWLNLGDSYASNTKGSGGSGKSRLGPNGDLQNIGFQKMDPRSFDHGLRPKDLVGIPWRVAFALQSDGWWLRQDIIWHKPNPMPESVTDRCTKAHEYVFLLTKSERYFYDVEAASEAASQSSGWAKQRSSGVNTWKYNASPERVAATGQRASDTQGFGVEGRRNRRSVWTVPTKPYSGAHFAVMPPGLVQPCILAGCPEGGTVLDPFSGAATVGLVSAQQGRKYIGIELNPDYCDIAAKRMEMELAQPLLDGFEFTTTAQDFKQSAFSFS